MTTKEYNGWTNYETWLVKLWMDNDEGSQNYWQEVTEETFKVDGNDADSSLADLLKENHEEQASERIGDSSGWLNDLISAALSEVNWQEIAHSLLTDYCEEYGKQESAA